MHRTVVFEFAPAIEWEYDEHGDPVRPGGRSLAEAIASRLAAGGASASAVEQHEDYGWAFSVTNAGDRFQHVLNPVERDVYLTIRMEGYLAKRLFLRRPEAAFERHCSHVSAALASIPGVSDLDWESRT
jgi:hypothetical protein